MALCLCVHCAGFVVTTDKGPGSVILSAGQFSASSIVDALMAVSMGYRNVHTLPPPACQSAVFTPALLVSDLQPRSFQSPDEMARPLATAQESVYIQ